jgi:hypothetical protein
VEPESSTISDPPLQAAKVSDIRMKLRRENTILFGTVCISDRSCAKSVARSAALFIGFQDRFNKKMDD